MQARTCPRSDAHDPHDRGALFCWVCGHELACATCGYPISDHLYFKDERCPVVRLRLPVPSATNPSGSLAIRTERA